MPATPVTPESVKARFESLMDGFKDAIVGQITMPNHRADYERMEKDYRALIVSAAQLAVVDGMQKIMLGRH